MGKVHPAVVTGSKYDFFEFACGAKKPSGATCQVRLGREQRKDAAGFVWGWDGNVEKPTLVASINCNGPGGCGRHFVVAKGVEKTAQ